MKTLYNKNVLIIGAAGELGQALALEFSKERANIIAVDNRKEALADIERTIGNRRTKIRGYRGDLNARKEAAIIFSDIIKNHDQIDVLVFADSLEIPGQFETTSVDDIENIIGRAIVSTIWVTKFVFNHMIARKKGDIVWIPPFNPAKSTDGIIDGMCGAGLYAMFDGIRRFLGSQSIEVPVLIGHYGDRDTEVARGAYSIVQALVKGKSSVRV
jgi:NADP-dependent 3-hydroxy acid dehydrogenase YdfG